MYYINWYVYKKYIYILHNIVKINKFGNILNIQMI